MEKRYPRVVVCPEISAAAWRVENGHGAEIEKFAFNVCPVFFERVFEERRGSALLRERKCAAHGDAFPRGVGVVEDVVAELPSGGAVVNQTRPVEVASGRVMLLFFRDKPRPAMQNVFGRFHDIDSDPCGVAGRSEADGAFSERCKRTFPVCGGAVFCVNRRPLRRIDCERIP